MEVVLSVVKTGLKLCRESWQIVISRVSCVAGINLLFFFFFFLFSLCKSLTVFVFVFSKKGRLQVARYQTFSQDLQIQS